MSDREREREGGGREKKGDREREREGGGERGERGEQHNGNGYFMT